MAIAFSRRRLSTVAAVAAVATVVAACSTTPDTEEEISASTKFHTSTPPPRALTSFGRQSQGVGVNTFLWRGALETVSFMPLTSADAYGGVIITDWYTPPETPDERFKINLYIRGSELQSDGVKAVIFRQKRAGAGVWVDDQVDQQTAVDLENAILAQARQLRLQSLDQ